MTTEANSKVCVKSSLNTPNVCSRMGRCGDGKQGSGKCACPAGFTGDACDKGACPAGHYLKMNATSALYACVKCEAGKYCKEPGSVQKPDGRQDCVPGEFCPEGSSAAQRCSPGRFSPNPTVNCTACVAGRFQQQSGQAACVDCALGKTYQDKDGPGGVRWTYCG